MTNDLKKFIEKGLPIDGQWWNSSGMEKIIDVAEKLLVKGLTEKEIQYILEDVYSAVSCEFGN